MEKTTIPKRSIFLIACGVLAKDVEKLTARGTVSIDSKYLPGGLHENPGELRRQVQAVIDEVSAIGKYERIAIGYGVCGRGTVGIKARGIPLLLPRVHDCISFFLGGNAAYKKEFKRFPGTYYISAGWYEEKTEPLSQKRPYAYLGDKRVYYDELVREVGEQSAKETFDFLNSWKKNYQRAAFIDTGAGDSRIYADYTQKMAKQHGWRYEALLGDDHLLIQLLLEEKTTDEILVVPPGHITVFDAVKGRLNATSRLTDFPADKQPTETIEQIKVPTATLAAHLTTGLGIDAGGTYTDTVLFDLKEKRLLGKHKSLTTKWDYTVGIGKALSSLDHNRLNQVELVAVSTTLATNAIVEGEGQKVGLFLMSPAGMTAPADIAYEPKALIKGALEITGQVIEKVDEDQVRRIARKMVSQQGVQAFAVSGFAGAINPAHELTVKELIRAETGCLVTCGHELSDLLNFKTRAQTAVLNARIVPRLVKLLTDLDLVLDTAGVKAPVMVVKGDGSMISRAMAVERPVETILSGPAASVAGARFLTDCKDAMVVDMGGTTTDTAALKDGAVEVDEAGSKVGHAQTHVKALKIRTCGLGGDSLITYDHGRFVIGPRRVAPICWLGSRKSGPDQTIRFLQRRLNGYQNHSRHMVFFALNDTRKKWPHLNAIENQLVALLRGRSFSAEELASKLGILHPSLLPLRRLEDDHIIQRCGLTPTDLLHIRGRFTRWNTHAAKEVCALLAQLSGHPLETMVDDLLTQVVEQLSLELFKKLLDSNNVQPEDMENCTVCRAILTNLFQGQHPDVKVNLTTHRPVIGIGAPIGYFLPPAAKLLGAEFILPEHADVANAVGAITSHIVVKRQLNIRPDDGGGYYLKGLPQSPRFKEIDQAEEFARTSLCEQVRNLAREAGTSQETIELSTTDRTVRTAQGDALFLERTIKAQLVGQPNLMRAS